MALAENLALTRPGKDADTATAEDLRHICPLSTWPRACWAGIGASPSL